MNKVKKINDLYILSQISILRSSQSSPEELRMSLKEIGCEFGKKIIEEFYLQEKEITTPMNCEVRALVADIPLSIVITTKEDANHLGKGLSEILKNSMQGYMDFEGRRGPETLTNPIREIVLPDVNNERVGTLIIGKTMLATGCTAISLTKTALSKYLPDKLVIASIFYSIRGLKDLQREFPNAFIFLINDPDDLNEEGLLVPGVGLINERTKQTTFV